MEKNNLPTPLPCPFCGCKPKKRVIDTQGSSTFSTFHVVVECVSKRCPARPEVKFYNRFADNADHKKNIMTSAVNKWNIRKYKPK